MVEHWNVHIVKHRDEDAILAACARVYGKSTGLDACLVVDAYDEEHQIFAVEYAFDWHGTRTLAGDDLVEEAGAALSTALDERVISLFGCSKTDDMHIAVYEGGAVVDEEATFFSDVQRFRRFGVPLAPAVSWGDFGTNGPDPFGHRIPFDRDLPPVPVVIDRLVNEALRTPELRDALAERLAGLVRERRADEIDVAKGLHRMGATERGVKLLAQFEKRRKGRATAYSEALAVIAPDLLRTRADDPSQPLETRVDALRALGDEEGAEVLRQTFDDAGVQAVLALRAAVLADPQHFWSHLRPVLDRAKYGSAERLAAEALQAEVQLMMMRADVHQNMLDALAAGPPALRALGNEIRARKADQVANPVPHLRRALEIYPGRKDLVVQLAFLSLMDGAADGASIEQALHVLSDSDLWRAPVVAAAVASGQHADMVHYYSGVRPNPNPLAEIPCQAVLTLVEPLRTTQPTLDDFAAIALAMYDAGFEAAAALCEDAYMAVSEEHPLKARLGEACRVFGLV